MKRIELTDAELGKILSVYNDMLLDKYYSDIPVHEFSNEFNTKMDNLIQTHFSNKRKRKKNKRTAFILAAAILLICGFAVTINACRDSGLSYFDKIYEKLCSGYFDTRYAAENIEKCNIGYIPDGFEVDSYAESDSDIIWIYKNDKDQFIEINQFIFKNRSLGHNLSGNNKDVLINDRWGVISEDKGCVNILFDDDKYFYNIYGSIDADEIKKIAESIK